jgi:hypothetical protein
VGWRRYNNNNRTATTGPTTARGARYITFIVRRLRGDERQSSRDRDVFTRVTHIAIEPGSFGRTAEGTAIYGEFFSHPSVGLGPAVLVYLARRHFQ